MEGALPQTGQQPAGATVRGGSGEVSRDSLRWGLEDLLDWGSLLSSGDVIAGGDVVMSCLVWFGHGLC